MPTLIEVAEWGAWLGGDSETTSWNCRKEHFGQLARAMLVYKPIQIAISKPALECMQAQGAGSGLPSQACDWPLLFWTAPCFACSVREALY